MTKRFTDTEKWRKGFIRSLEAPYKLLYLYILDECDHAGIWHVELDVACVRIGFDIKTEDALKAFEKRVHPFDDGEKWFIPDFIHFQYGDLNETNRVHQSVVRQLKKYNLFKALNNPLQGAKDKEKDKDKDKYKDKEKDKDKEEETLAIDNLYSKGEFAKSEASRKKGNVDFDDFWQLYPRKTEKKKALKAWKIAKKDKSWPGLEAVLFAVERQKASEQWKKDGGQFIPYPATWLNSGRWDDEERVAGQGYLELIDEIEEENKNATGQNRDH
jgi:Ni/Co efflux regulator RcnB